jgi:hypothetical protein
MKSGIWVASRSASSNGLMWINFLVVHVRRTFCDCGASVFGKLSRTQVEHGGCRRALSGGVRFRSLAAALAVGTLDPERSDVLSKIRKDFDAAGVAQSDEQILRVMNEFTLQAGNQMPVTAGGAPDALALMLARQLKS